MLETVITTLLISLGCIGLQTGQVLPDQCQNYQINARPALKLEVGAQPSRV